MSVTANYASLVPDLDEIWAQLMAHAVADGDCVAA